MNPPRRWPLDPRRRRAPRLRPGRFRWKESPHDPAPPPAARAWRRSHAPGTVRARRWHGDGDVRGYRPPSGWTARADLTDIHPITGCALPACRVVDHRDEGITERHRAQAVPPGRPVNEKSGARQWPRPVPSAPKPSRPPPPDRRRQRGGRTSRPCAQKRSKPCKCIGARAARARFQTTPRRNGRRSRGYAPACCRQVVRKRAVLDAGGSCPYVTKDGSPTSHPASLCGASTPRLKTGAARLRQERSPPVVGRLTWPASGGKPVKPSRGDAESATSPFGRGAVRRGVLVLS